MKKYNSKRFIFILLSIFLSLFALVDVLAQEKDLKTQILENRDEAMRYAYRNLNGVGIKLNYRRAYDIFAVLAKNGDAEACNAIGMMFKQGLGPAQNDEKAMRWFQKAVEGGYAKAALNIALLYQYGHGVKQDYKKSIEWLEKAQEMGYDDIDYHLGYAYYKGLGVKQDYKTAFQYFDKGTKKENAACTYMLALCYYKGNGVARNPEQGKILMEKAADLGVSRATDIISRNDSKTYGEKKPVLKSSNNTVFDMIPTHYAAVSNNSEAAELNLDGKWEGSLVQYDWSGNDITKEAKLSLSIEKSGDRIEGVWTEDDTLSVRISATLSDSVWVFDNIVLYEQKRPVEMRTGSFRIVEKDGREFLTGNIAFYSETIREFTAPNYLVLERRSPTAINVPLADNQVIVSPNPFSDRINVKITLVRPEKIRLVTYDLSGKKIETSELFDFQAGTNSATLYTADYPKGSYILKVAGETVNKSFTLVK
jgi:TPR repeat protein